MFNKSTTLCFTGHRSQPKGLAMLKLKKRLLEEIERAATDGYDTFLCGCAVGWDTLCGLSVLQLQRSYPHIKLVAVVPFKAQDEKYSPKEKQIYQDILSKCERVIITSGSYHKDCYKVRNQFMVDNSSAVIAYYNVADERSGTGQTVRMAERKSLKITNIY